jgi:hypothetical protein
VTGTVGRAHELGIVETASKLNNNNNYIKFFIIYVPSQQLQGQLQTKHSVGTGNYIMDKHNIKSKTSYRQILEEKNSNAEKQTNKRR